MIIKIGSQTVSPVLVKETHGLLQDKTASPSTSSQVVTFDDGYSGLNEVTVNPVTASIDANIASGNIKTGVSILGVSGSVTPVNNQTLTVTPTTSQQTKTPGSGYTGFSIVTVNAVTSAIDSNITAGNIKLGTTILGVQGTLPVINNQSVTVTPTVASQTINPSSGYTGLGPVTVNAVTASIDSNIVSTNILSGVTILGVEGSVVTQSYYTGSGAPSASLGSNGDIYLQV